MGATANLWALLVSVAAFAAWTLSRFTLSRNRSWSNFLGAMGILALFFSAVSPDDDGFQQVWIHSSTSVRVSAHARVILRRSPARSAASAMPPTVDSLLVNNMGPAFGAISLLSSIHISTDRPSIHSPPQPSYLLSDSALVC
jgi:hypothetical protein